MYCRIPLLAFRSVFAHVLRLISSEVDLTVWSEVERTIWSGLAQNLADLLLLGWREIVELHIQCLELSLPGEDGKQGAQALVSTFKPLVLIDDGHVLQGVQLSIGEGSEELGAI